MIPTHRNLDHVIQRLSAPATLAPAGPGAVDRLPVVGGGLRPASARPPGARSRGWWRHAWPGMSGPASAARSMELSDYILCDIGISRAAAIDEAEKPFWRS